MTEKTKSLLFILKPTCKVFHYKFKIFFVTFFSLNAIRLTGGGMLEEKCV